MFMSCLKANIILLFGMIALGYPAMELTLVPTNSFWVTIPGDKDDRFTIGDDVDLKGIFISAGEYGDVLVFTMTEENHLEVRHFYLTSAGPIARTSLRKPVHMRAIITGNKHYGYGFEVSILSLDEVAVNDILTIPIKQAMRQAAWDTAWDISQINLSDISLPQEVQYNAGFRIASYYYRGTNLDFSFWDETGDYIGALDDSLRLPPFDDPRIIRVLEVYYIYSCTKAQMDRIVVTAHGEFLE
jgi:hypothetical protein